MASLRGFVLIMMVLLVSFTFKGKSDACSFGETNPSLFESSVFNYEPLQDTNDIDPSHVGEEKSFIRNTLCSLLGLLRLNCKGFA
ncbi:hypothetical protein CASFOL_035617 [Castilleja foliolosa]|uniref:Uncharacterized protein n=1 Tax=Castilleja foliolosa TaxID=1961234 RepID=A0ABD3BTD6_9LAMI